MIHVSRRRNVSRMYTFAYLSHREPCAIAKHLLLVFGRIRVSQMLREPRFQDIGSISRQIPSSPAWLLTTNLFLLKLQAARGVAGLKMR